MAETDPVVATAGAETTHPNRSASSPPSPPQLKNDLNEEEEEEEHSKGDEREEEEEAETPQKHSKGDKEGEEEETETPPTTTTTNAASFLHPYQMTPLPPDFTPGPYDVLCGRGRVCKDAPGNRKYRDTILKHLQVYVQAETKLQKGQIITNIMQGIREQCAQSRNGTGGGGFVKCVAGVWYDVGDFLAREKTSQCFRDALAAHYSSAAQSKYQRRRAREEAAAAHPDQREVRGMDVVSMLLWIQLS